MKDDNTTDWKAIAAAIGLEADDRSIAPLIGLEKAFRPLALSLTANDDIAVDYASTLKGDAQ